MASRRKGHGRTFEGDYLADGFRFAIVVSRFNEYITSKMLEGCENTLNRHGVKPDDIDVVWVPGSFEIPTAARRIAQKKAADAIICLGCVIRGDTAHYEHICREAAKGISEVAAAPAFPRSSASSPARPSSRRSSGPAPRWATPDATPRWPRLRWPA